MIRLHLRVCSVKCLGHFDRKPIFEIFEHLPYIPCTHPLKGAHVCMYNMFGWIPFCKRIIENKETRQKKMYSPTSYLVPLKLAEIMLRLFFFLDLCCDFNLLCSSTSLSILSTWTSLFINRSSLRCDLYPEAMPPGPRTMWAAVLCE